MRISENINYAGLDLAVYGDVNDGRFDCDRIEIGAGIENAMPIISEGVVEEINEIVSDKLAEIEAENRRTRGGPDRWKYDREAA